MSVPITARLDEETVAALDRAVRAGIGASRAAVVAEAVREWVARHFEEVVAASYRRAYAEPNPDEVALVARLSSYSAASLASGSEK
jgi:Arc/MetJ-type ribon-helix-helix transcriptional regulator